MESLNLQATYNPESYIKSVPLERINPDILSLAQEFIRLTKLEASEPTNKIEYTNRLLSLALLSENYLKLMSQSPSRNLLLLGETNAGKSTLANHITQKKYFNVSQDPETYCLTSLQPSNTLISK